MTPTIPTDLIDRLEKSQPVLRHMIANWRRGGALVRQIEKAIAQTACNTRRGMTPSEFVSMSRVASGEHWRDQSTVHPLEGKLWFFDKLSDVADAIQMVNPRKKQIAR